MEGDNLDFRYFDASGKQLTIDELRAMELVTPAMEHIFVTVLERLEKVEPYSLEKVGPRKRT